MYSVFAFGRFGGLVYSVNSCEFVWIHWLYEYIPNTPRIQWNTVVFLSCAEYTEVYAGKTLRKRGRYEFLSNTHEYSMEYYMQNSEVGISKEYARILSNKIDSCRCEKE